MRFFLVTLAWGGSAFQPDLKIIKYQAVRPVASICAPAFVEPLSFLIPQPGSSRWNPQWSSFPKDSSSAWMAPGVIRTVPDRNVAIKPLTVLEASGLI